LIESGDWGRREREGAEVELAKEVVGSVERDDEEVDSFLAGVFLIVLPCCLGLAINLLGVLLIFLTHISKIITILKELN
jgi:hypothetical protein